MSASIPTTEPISARAGDTWAWRREDLADYPASTWTLTYHFRNAGSGFDVTASPDGAVFAISVAKATTAGYVAGDYDWIAVVADATDRRQVGSGRLTVLPDFAAAATLDGRSFARKLLAAVEAELLTRGSSGQLDLVEAALADRNLKREAGGLMTLRSHLLSEVKREEAAGQGGGRNRLLVRFQNV